MEVRHAALFGLGAILGMAFGAWAAGGLDEQRAAVLVMTALAVGWIWAEGETA